MTSTAPSRRVAGRKPGLLAALVVGLALSATLGIQTLASSSSSTAEPVANLDPALRAAVDRAAVDAAADGIELTITSGWRSRADQERLVREAITTYGSEEEAARWVASPETSAHVSGDAVDVGPSSAAAWLSDNGARHGLCQIYRNETWHFELRPDAVVQGCPAMYDDPTHDPRMHP